MDAYTRLEMPGEVEIADGNWHNVVVTRQGNMAVLQVDYIGRVSRNTGKNLTCFSSRVFPARYTRDGVVNRKRLGTRLVVFLKFLETETA